ncbi:MAG: hypothetical protein H0X64_05360 [Gemmatimonadaceae bacterium]|nr:hypothetical protein [Gemmatimonadaceae bacterium]
MSHRVFTDPEGVSWQVWDVRPATSTESIQLRTEYAEGWLAFESELWRKRLVPIPEGWTEWTDEQLFDACKRAVQQPDRKRLIE